jgi:phosphatidylglycerophosphate synthase
MTLDRMPAPPVRLPPPPQASMAGPGSPPHAALRRELAWHLGGAALAVASVGTALALNSALNAPFVWTWLLLLGLAAWPLWRGLPWHAPHARFGPANRITLLRLLTVLGLAATLVVPADAAWVGGTAAWACVVIATTAALLDAVDGPLARRSGLASTFGARFDLETDALLIAVLALMLWQWGKVPAWVLLAGGLRYAFVAAAACWPWMNRPLPESLRRKTVCVLQIVVLIVGLGPVIPPGAATALAAAGLVLLVHSFAVDTLWLIRRRRAPLPQPLSCGPAQPDIPSPDTEASR